MRTDRRVNTAVGAFRGTLKGRIIKCFAHAMQALEFKRPAVVVRQLQNGGHGVGVVRRKLREDAATGVVRQ